jgi:2-(1,2-epoxy-1,2-dihydrophenyl)acetyl-CoA isomerase
MSPQSHQSYQTLTLDIADRVAYVTFNRPEVLNAYDWQMSQELPVCVEALADNPAIRVVVLQGHGRGFMAGGDISFLKQAQSLQVEKASVAIARLHETVCALKTMDKWVVGVAHGACAGAGLSLLLACDFAIARVGTQFKTAYIDLGLSPDGGMTVFLPRLAGFRKAMEWLVFSKPFFEQEALQYGLLNEVWSEAEYRQKLEAYVQYLAHTPQEAAVHLKALLRRSYDPDLLAQLHLESEGFLASIHSEDFRERVDAFLARKK